MRREETPTTRHSDGRAEHDVDALWSTMARAIASTVADIPDHRIAAVGLASVGETGVPLDDAGRPVRPAIAWFDSRGQEQADWWTEQVGRDRVGRITGQPIDAHYGVNRLLWLREHEPHHFERTRHWLSLADLVILRLTGEYVTDFTLASRTMVFDQRTLDWSDELLSVAGIDRSIFPIAVASGTRVGVVTEKAAADTGLSVGTPVVTGGHDRLCAAYAARGNELVPVDSTGSAEALVMPIDAYIEGDPSELGYAACYADVVPGRFVISARVGYAGAIIDWYRRLLEAPTGKSEPFSVDDVVDWPLIFSGLLCYPSFGRVVAPDWDPALAGGAIIGLDLGNRPSQIVQGLIEGVGYALRANVEWLERIVGHRVSTIRVEGAMVRSRTWMQLKADITGRHVQGVRMEEATALGAALLAGIGAGIYSDHASAAASVRHEVNDWQPTPELSRIYDDVFEDGFRQLPRALGRVASVLRRNSPDGALD